MRRIFKYSLPSYLGKPAVIDMPEGAQIVRLAQQDGAATLWAIVDDDNEVKPRRFQVLGTGFNLPRNAEYVGTYDRPPYVWHVVELVGEPLPDGLSLPADAEAAYRTLTGAGFKRRALNDHEKPRHDCVGVWIAPNDEPLTTELIMAVATLQEHGFGPVVSR